ncbi:unnamed protein product, partial [Haemonchus placei]|uniref:Rab3 GTPase-activating protein catalytic subunit n=1 Tax=Haemonchus placei TaxID=6290 RepID=A0A0N4W2D6_HAEPC
EHKTTIQGLGRFFKEVAQSARANSDDSTDDFLGCISMNLSDISPGGIEHWFPLQPRTEKSKVSGSVKLKLWLSTREERFGSGEDDLLDVKEHIGLMRQFTLYEIRLSGVSFIALATMHSMILFYLPEAPVRLWDGVFPDKANTILRQHALQGDLTEVHTAMWSVCINSFVVIVKCLRWLAFHSLISFDISFSLLAKALQNMQDKWQPMALDKVSLVLLL